MFVLEDTVETEKFSFAGCHSGNFCKKLSGIQKKAMDSRFRGNDISE